MTKKGYSKKEARIDAEKYIEVVDKIRKDIDEFTIINKYLKRLIKNNKKYIRESERLLDNENL